MAGEGAVHCRTHPCSVYVWAGSGGRTSICRAAPQMKLCGAMIFLLNRLPPAFTPCIRMPLCRTDMEFPPEGIFQWSNEGLVK